MTLNTILLQAQQAPQSFMEQYGLIVMMVLIFGVMYFLMIRPQQKRQKELLNFRKSLEKGNKIITAGGIYGTIKEVKENESTVLIEVDGNVTLRVDKSMIMRDTADFQTK